MTEMTLIASPRGAKGKNAMRKLRVGGLVPGVLYGQDGGDQYSLPLQLDAHEASRMLLHGGERLITLKIEDGAKAGEKSVLLKEVQTTAVGNRLVHVDFHEIDVSQTVQVSVELRPDGKAEGETMGGILQQVTREITIECLPTIIPEFITVAVSHMEIGHSVHLSAVTLPEGIKAITSLEETLFVVAAPRVEEEIVEAEGEEGELLEGEEGELAEGEEGAEKEGGEKEGSEES
jgi:large subunit ribosomal protein L25